MINVWKVKSLNIYYVSPSIVNESLISNNRNIRRHNWEGETC